MGNVGPRSDIGPQPAHSEDILLNDDIAVKVQKKRYPLLKICPMSVLDAPIAEKWIERVLHHLLIEKTVEDEL